MLPLISVVIPTYNNAPLLKKALQSVFNQSYHNFEVIVINNFSTDNTIDVVSSIKDKRIRLINFKNEGVIGRSRNVGIKESRGGWIAFLDSDDVWYPDKLAVCSNAIMEDPGAILVAHRLVNKREEAIIGSNELGKAPPNMYYSLLFHGSRFATSAVIAKKSTLKELGGFSERPDYAGVEDYDLWLRLSKVGRFLLINRTLGEYAIHDYNFSSDIEKRSKHWMNVLNTHFNDLPQKEDLKRRINASRANVLFNAGWNSLKIGDFSGARRWFYRSFKTHPLSIKVCIGFTMSLFHIRLSKRLNRLAIKVNNMRRALFSL